MILLHPWWLIPALLFLIAFLLLRTITSNDWRKVVNSRVLQFLLGDDTVASRWHPGLLFTAIACVALTGPSTKAQDNQTFKHTQGWVVLADVSRSMTLTDVVPSRLSAMRDVALRLAANANASSTTLIIYAGDAFVVAPPSFDSANFSNNVSLLEYGIVPVDGSNITRALGLALSVIDRTGLVNSRLFVLSDTGGFNSRASSAVNFILFGGSDADKITPFDKRIAQTMAKSGGGQLLVADAIGNVSFAKLELRVQDFDSNVLTQSGITTLRWDNFSHWILLAGIPLLLLLFRRDYL